MAQETSCLFVSVIV